MDEYLKYKSVQDTYAEGTRQISSVTSENGASFNQKENIKEEETTVYQKHKSLHTIILLYSD